METTVPAQSTTSISTKKIARTRKGDRKKKNDDEKIFSPSQAQGSQGLDLGYISGGSQCTPGMVAIGSTGNPPIGHTPLSGYNSSGCDTEFSSLPEEQGISSLAPNAGCITEQMLDYQRIKTEQFSPPSQGRDVPYGHPPPYKPSFMHNRKYRPSNLHTLPEIIGPTQGMNSGGRLFNPSKTILLHETFSSGYSSIDGSRASDEVSLISGSSGHQPSYRSSDLSSSSRSSFSTFSSQLPSPPPSSYRRDSFEQSNRSIKPPDLVLKPMSLSMQMADFKNAPHLSYYPQQQSDQMSIRSSHSSRYSGSMSEYSEDFHHHPPLPDIHSTEFSPRQPLPPISNHMGFHMQMNNSQSQSMPMSFEPSQYLPPATSITNLQSPENYSADSMSGGSIPLQHLEISSQKGGGFPMIVNTQVRSESPNLLIGNMSSFSNQLQQENLLLESLASASSLSHSNLVQLPH